MNGAEPDKRPPPTRKERRDQHVQEQLDEALADTFPASDPVSIAASQEEEDWGPEEKPDESAPGGPRR